MQASVLHLNHTSKAVPAHQGASDPGLLAWSGASAPTLEADAGALTSGLALVVCTYKRSASLRRFLESLAVQDRRPDELIIVDASPDDATEQMLKQYHGVEHLADRLLYVRVSGPLKGLTRQRNFALRCVTTDLVVFFDDDIVLLPGCLREMEKPHRSFADHVTGVGAFMQNQCCPAAWPLLWRVRRRLGMTANLQPGRYHRSGVSTPWIFLSQTDELVEGDWLPGCAMMWKTAVAREVGFNEPFDGYAQGEDLDFSLRARRRGKLLVAGTARVLHLYEPSGRPDPFKWGYMAIYNKYQIHRRALPDRTWRDMAWFTYAWTVDTLLLARHLAWPSMWAPIVKQIAGRLRAVHDILRGR